jgi:tyrosinase
MTIDVGHVEDATRRGLTAGVILPGAAPRMRKEIDEFIKDTDCFNLYLLALTDLQRLPGTTVEHYYGTRSLGWEAPFSYFQIAGIHGKPFSPWDGVTQESLGIRRQAGDDQAHEPSIQAGYCSHSSDLFPTWHRAYLAMYEQTIFLQMISIARAFPQQYQKRYLDACEGFGIPYWDPFLPRRKITNKYGYSITKCGIPVIMSSKDVRIRTPRQPDSPINAPNPLYSYQFASGSSDWSKIAGHPIDFVFGDVMNNPRMTLNTIRGPTPTGSTNHQYVNNTLTNAVSTATGPALPLGSKIYRILQGPPLNYTQMATSAYVAEDEPTTQNKENSLEGFHNDIHTMCGNGGDGRTGHMGLTEYAAFDPIFWMHHTNIDRIFAIWQALNPDTWGWDQHLLDSPTYVRGIGDKETPTSWLVPFRRKVEETFDPFTDQEPAQHEHQPDVKWWTSNDLKHCSDLGYTYPELRLVKQSEKTPDVRPLRQWVTDTYEWSTIYGETPPWQSLFDSEDFSRVEALPEVTRIDGLGDPVRVETPVETKPNISAKMSNWFRHRGSGRTPGSRNNDRYEHIRPLMKAHTLTHWNITVKVRK